MRIRLLGLYILFFFNCLLALCFSFIGIEISAVGVFIFGSIVISLLTLHGWLSYVKELILQSNVMLNRKDRLISTWAFGNIALLSQNQELLERKFLTSAGLISNLDNPKEVDRIDDLDSTDPIGNALQLMKTKIQKIKEADDHKEWIAQGLTRFSEVLRNKMEVNEYGRHIINGLATYLKVNQGGLFIEYQNSEGERYLDRVASYAFDMSRFDGTTRIFAGEGILGQCMLEQNFVFITDVPRNYVKINSGLGGAIPKAITIAPLVFNDKFYGAIELASFDILQPHQVDFLKIVCEDIASEISALKNVEHTKALLNESTQMAKELQSREEGMKESMEELTATQEEMAKKQEELSNTIKEAERSQRELKSYLSGIDNTIASAEFGLDGKIKGANEIFLKVSGYTMQEILHKNYDLLMGEDSSIKMMWENLSLGKFFSGEFKMKNKIGKELWLTGTFNPITIEGTVPEKIMMFAQFSTQEKEKLNDLTSMVHALKATLPVIEFNHDFACKIANDKALKLFEVSRLQLRSKTVLDFIAPCYHDTWNELKSNILRNDFSNIIIPFYSGRQILNYEVSISMTKNLEGEITKIIFLLVKVVTDVRHLEVN